MAKKKIKKGPNLTKVLREGEFQDYKLVVRSVPFKAIV
jgi:hypothetical protein